MTASVSAIQIWTFIVAGLAALRRVVSSVDDVRHRTSIVAALAPCLFGRLLGRHRAESLWPS